MSVELKTSTNMTRHDQAYLEAFEAQREDLHAGLKSRHPMTCPMCDQRVQLYRRKLTLPMVRYLENLYAATGGDTMLHVHTREFCTGDGSGDYGKLRFWNLIEPATKREKEKNSSGLWSITQVGVGFIQGTLTVPLHVYVYNDTYHGQDESAWVGVEDVHAGFDYAELMSGGY